MDEAWKARMTGLFGGRCARCDDAGDLGYVEATPQSNAVRRMWAVVPLCSGCRRLVGKRNTPPFVGADSGVRSLLLLGAAHLYTQRTDGC
jgi:hypothetical protein